MQANLEKHIKELKLRIVDLETKSYNSPRSTIGRRGDSRIDEITNQLQQTNSKVDVQRIQRSADKIARDAKFQQAESERQRTKMEEERRAYQAEIADLRHHMNEIVCHSLLRPLASLTTFQQTADTNLQAAKRRAEREAADFKAKNLRYDSSV